MGAAQFRRAILTLFTSNIHPLESAWQRTTGKLSQNTQRASNSIISQIRLNSQFNREEALNNTKMGEILFPKFKISKLLIVSFHKIFLK